METGRLKENSWRLALSLAAAGLVVCASLARAEEPRPEQLREQMRDLEQKARELQAAGQEDQAQAVRHELQELREQFARLARERHVEQPGGDERRAELQRKLEHARAELKESREAGQEERAVDLQRGIHKLEMELAPSRPPGGRDRGPAQRTEQLPVEQRLQHIREAIGHLHAAGLHELADKLAREAEEMQQQLRAPPPGQPGAETARLQAEIQELRQAIRKLNERLDGRNREPR